MFHPLWPRRMGWGRIGLQLTSGTVSGEGRAVSQGSVADTGIAVLSRKQYVGHSVLRKWLEEQGSGSRNDFQRNNTDLAHIRNGPSPTQEVEN